MDKFLISAKLPSPAWSAGEGLKFLFEGENADYFADDVLLWQRHSFENLRDAARNGYKILLDSARHVAANKLWKEAGIPQNAVRLVEHSLRGELGLHLAGRFDFAGGIDSEPVKILEFNADTFSLLPETSRVQPQIVKSTGGGLKPVFDRLDAALETHFRKILAARPDKEPSLLLSWMGYEEDLLNIDVVARAARAAGFRIVQPMMLDRVIFDPDEGIFIELGPDKYRQYDFWFKMVPWDFIAYEEPELMDLLTDIVTKDLAVVINPAFTMLLQSKGLLKIAHELYPQHPNFLKTTSKASDFPDKKYVEKPIFGRTGDNVRLFNGDARPAEANDGDYGNFPKVYQELALLETDGKGYYYQPSLFWVGEDVADVAVRRQEDWIIDDDAEFVASGVM